MPRPLVLLGLLVSSGITCALAQSATSATVPATPAPIATIKENAQLVVVDVVVTDKNRRPVHGLKATDFTLTDDNTPQTIGHFEEHSALTLADTTRLGPQPVLPPGQFTNYSPAPVNGAVNVLLLDALNTPMTDQAYVRRQMLAYLKTVPPGTRIAIYGLSSRLVVLQSFTSDPEVLKAVITRGLSKASSRLDDPASSGGGQIGAANDWDDFVRQFLEWTHTVQLPLRAQLTLDAMNEIAHSLAGIPGRKNLLWFSGSFPINIVPGVAVAAGVEDEFRETVNLLARSQVAVYPIDARGLFSSPSFEASSSSPDYGNQFKGEGTIRMEQDQAIFVTETAAEHNTMRAMAEATGGRAFVDTNALTHAVADAIDDGSNFYTLTYTPANYQLDGEMHTIKVEVDRQGVALAYRHGYYADRPARNSPAGNAPVQDAASADPGGSSSPELMHLAMARSAPIPTDILIRVSVVPITPADKPADQPAPGNQPGPKTHGPYRRYSVNTLVDPAGFTFLRTPDGKLHADFGLMVLAYDPNGALMNSQIDTIHIAAPLDELKKIFAQAHHEEISVPASGEYTLRIAVHDLHRDRYGAVEVATSEVKNLAPVTAPPATPAPPAAPSSTGSSAYGHHP
jgi:VWFA-related protein